MARSRGNDFFRQGASLSQKLADQDKIFTKLSGSNPELSKAIGALLVLGKHGILDLKDPSMKLMMDILDVQRKAEFATSERTNEITKMGLMMPRSDAVYFDE